MAQEQNAYRSQAKPETTTESTEPREIDYNKYITQMDNPLLRYDNVAWKFKLFTLHSTDYVSYQQTGLDKLSKVVIAETGVTGSYNINEVQMVTTPPGQKRTKNASMLNMNIEMIEHGSMTFFDQLQMLTGRLDYNQVMNIPLFLELTFVGFDPVDGKTQSVPGTARVWCLHINKIDTSLSNNDGTTVYSIQCTSQTRGYYGPEWKLQEHMELTATRTVRDFIKVFSERLNKNMHQQYGYLTDIFPNDILPTNYYEFKVHPILGDMILTNDATQDPAKDKGPNGEGTKRFVFKPDMTIGQALDDIMDSVSTPDDNSKDFKRQFVNIVPVRVYIGYDPFRKKHAYRYVINVLPYNILDVQDIDEAVNKNTAFDLKKVFDKVMPRDKQNKYIIKKYDYTWSGTNVEVLRLDFDFNAAYTLVATRNVQSLFDTRNRKGEKRPDLNPADPILSQIPQLYKRIQSLKLRQQSGSLTTSERDELARTELTYNEYTNRARVEGDSTQRGLAQTEYLEDTSDIDAKALTSGVKPSYLRIPADYGNLDDVSSSTIDSNNTQTEQAKRAVKSNYYNDAYLLKLNIDVIGDPYWLGQSDLEIVNDIQQLVSGAQLQGEDVPKDKSYVVEPCFLLNLQPARSYSETGLASGTQSFMQQGIYRVNKVTSTFNSGGFTQNIEASLITRSINRSRE